jgi:gentisate 1,2-dioxygenase
MNSTADNAATQQYYRELSAERLAPLWESLGVFVPAEIAPRAIAHTWAYQNVRPLLMRAGSMIRAQEAERRVLVLENPALLGASKITDTLYAGLQLILPGDVVHAHRHSQSALRFVIEGRGAFTSVDGERTTMHPGDFIITPAWTWDDRGQEGDEPVIRMDGLDVPLVSFLCAGFREEYVASAQQILRSEGTADASFSYGMLPHNLSEPTRTSPIFSYPYERTRAALDMLTRGDEPDACFGYALRYIYPRMDGWAIPTAATSMRLLPAGFESRPYRATESTVMTVMEGSVHADVEGQGFELLAKDTLAVPAWRIHKLRASEESVLFVFSDRLIRE